MSQRAVRRSMSRATAVTAGSIVLAGVAFWLALIPGPSMNGVPTYVFMNSAAARLGIETAVAISSLGFLIGATERWTAGLPIAGVTFVSVVVLGGFLFVYTLLNGVSVVSGGTTIVYQSFPQSVYLVIWGGCGLALLPVGLLVRNRFLPFPPIS